MTTLIPLWERRGCKQLPRVMAIEYEESEPLRMEGRRDDTHTKTHVDALFEIHTRRVPLRRRRHMLCC